MIIEGIGANMQIPFNAISEAVLVSPAIQGDGAKLEATL